MARKGGSHLTGAGLLSIVAAVLSLSGCAIPLVTYAPTTRPIAETKEVALVETALRADPQQRAGMRVALRGGRVTTVRPPSTETGSPADLPSAELRRELDTGYVPPFDFRPTQAGGRHYYNFTVTPEFERATGYYLNGQAEDAIREIDAILAGEGKHPAALLWQAAYLKVNVLVLMGRPDVAERETARVEAYEIAAMGGNHASRALRAEVKYWAGDLDGAIEDAATVIRAFGDWRFATAYPVPPLDQVELARCVTAQVRADIVLGLALQAKGQRQAALPWLELANQTMNNVLYVSRHPIYAVYFQPPEEVFWGRGLSLLSLATALLANDPNSQRAGQLFTQAADYFAALGFRAGKVMIEAFKAQALSWAGAHERAAAQAAAGLALAESLGLVDYVWRLEALRGMQLLALQRTAEAERALRRAQAVVDLIAGTMAYDDAKVRFGLGKESITRDLVRIDLRSRNLPQLFEDMERGRARSFVAMLANRAVALDRGGPLVDQVRGLDREINQERQRKNALSARPGGDPAREQRLLEQRAGLVAQLRRQDPDLADALSVAAVALPSVQQALPRNTALIYVVPTEDAEPLSLLVVTANAAKLQTLSIGPLQLKQWLDDFRQALDQGDVARQRGALGTLRQQLGIVAWPTVEAVYLVPSGHAHFIPWGGLDTGFAVATLPNGGWVARAPLALQGTARAAVIGDPEFGGVLPQLPGARQEALAVSRLYSANALLGTAATEGRLRAMVGPSVDVLHLATHALYDPRYPLQSSLILSDGQRPSPLTAERLFAQPLSARLVILSACETGMGTVAGGEELLGLTRSFYLGGASSVISSLWPVDDEATRLFMETFHAESRQRAYGSAWLAALNAVKAGGFPPAAYGAFVLGGSLGSGRQP